MKSHILTAGILLLTFRLSFSQSVSMHVPWTEEDSAAVNALALYPDSTRLKIYQACEYPAIIVNAASLQKNSSTAFANLINSYTKSQQEDLWNLCRYPNMIETLADGGKKSKSQIDSIVSQYPAGIHNLAVKYAENNYDILKSISDLQKNVDGEFKQLLSSYPPDIQTLFGSLLQLPAVLTLLNQDLNLTVRVGDHYKRNPEKLVHRMDSVAAALQVQQAKDVQDWKNTLQQDSNTRNDFKNAANAYADSNGYDNSEVDQPMSDVNVNDYNVDPYNYWFGYPSWYPDNYWYPYPYWYDWGFYYGADGNMVVFGMPSYYFSNWYFGDPGCWGNYPYLGSAYMNFYYGEDNMNTMGSLVAHNWVQENRRYLPANFTKKGAHRSEVFKQMAQLNKHSMNKDGTINEATRSKYFMNNKSRFSALNQNPAQPKVPEERNISDVRQPFTRQPAVNASMIQTRQPVRQSAGVQRQYNYANRQNSGNYSNPQRNYNYNNVQRSNNNANVQRNYNYGNVRSSYSAPHYNYSNIQRATSFHSAGWSQPSSSFGGGGMRSFGGGGGGGMRSIGGGGGVRSFGGGGAIRR